jgi:two-component system cell cycle sensor histidine kinase/response regulator CckA
VDSSETKASILLVDDEEMVLTLGRVILERRGYQVCVAHSGTEAIAVCRERTEPLHCAIIDFTMPDMNGRETLTEIRKIFTGIPALISSGYSDEEIVHAMGGLEFNGMIHKPYRQEALVAALQQALQPI